MRAVFLLLAALPLLAQGLVDPSRLPAGWKTFSRVEGKERLRCQVHSYQPGLTLGFRFQTGYLVEVPMAQYTGEGRWIQIVLRVTPESEDRQPVWLTSRINLPRVPKTKATAQFGGGFLLGEGKYKVDMLLVDAEDRRCLADWDLRAKASKEVRDVGGGLPPGAVDDVGFRRWGRALARRAESASVRHDVSILLHVSSLSPRRFANLRSYDRTVLLNALASMLDRLPVRKVRLTLFSLEKQAEVYHTEDFSSETFREAIDALQRIELGTIDYSVYQNRKGHLDFLSDLLHREMSHSEKTDAVIILGPPARSGDRVPEEDLPARNGAPPIYYAELRTSRRVESVLPDTIARTIKRLGGRRKEVYTPQDFAEAIQEIEKLLEGVSRSGIDVKTPASI